MTKCKCGSYAINHDPARVLCDCCWRDATIDALKAELADTRDALRLAVADQCTLMFWDDIGDEHVESLLKRIRELKAAAK